MTPEEVKRVVSAQIRRGLHTKNLHGITPENLDTFLVPPYEALVDPDDLETPPRPMWVVLHEHQDPRQGYAVVFDPQSESWGVIEFNTDSTATLIVAASSLSDAIDAM